MRLLQRLDRLPTLENILDELAIKPRTGRGRGITFGSEPAIDAEHLLGIPFLSGRHPKRRFALEAKEFPVFSKPNVKSGSDLILDLPALAVSRAPLGLQTCASLVEPDGLLTKMVVAQSYYGISFGRSNPGVSRRVNAVLNSDLALYWTFMTGMDIGVSVRNLIEVADWDRLPMPPDILSGDAPEWSEVAQLERALAKPDSRMNGHAENERLLNEAVLGLYGLSTQDKVQVKETVRFTIRPFLRRRRTTINLPPDESVMDSFARRICLQLNETLRFAGTELTATICGFPKSTPIRACRFTLDESGTNTPIDRISFNGIDELLGRISTHLRGMVAENLFVQRDLRVYDERTVWIIKSAEDRLWSEAAALYDADLIVGEQLMADGRPT